MQRRAAHKDSHPNLLDISCGGHLVAGEGSLDGAISELYEELGIKVQPEDLIYLFSGKSSTRPHPGFINNSFYDFYLLRGNYEASELKLQAEEVSEVIWLPLADLKTAIAKHNPDFVWHGLYVKLFEYLGI